MSSVAHTTRKVPIRLIVGMVLLGVVAVGDLPIGAPADVPLLIVVIGITLCIGGAVALVGLILRHRWAAWLAVADLVLSGLMAATGALFADELYVRLTTAATVILVAVAITLILAPTSRRSLR